MASLYPLIAYPWQQSLWQNLLQQVETDRLPHALLLTGQRGVGKLHYAHTMANYLLCLQPKSGLACNKCRSCQLNEANTHPDKRVVTSEGPGKQIKIDQVRQLSEFVATTAQQGGRKVVVLTLAEQLNTNSANALLKNLEEPTADTYFILVSQVVSSVMPTIHSRCQIASFPIPDRALSIRWLKELGLSGNLELSLDISAGAPLLAQSLFDNDVAEQIDCFYTGLLQAQNTSPSIEIAIVKSWLDIELSSIIEWWLQLVQKAIKSGSLMNSDSPSHNSSHKTSQVTDLAFAEGMLDVQLRAEQYNKQWLFRFLDKLFIVKKQLLRGANLNKQLMLEELLLDWYAIIRSANP